MLVIYHFTICRTPPAKWKKKFKWSEWFKTCFKKHKFVYKQNVCKNISLLEAILVTDDTMRVVLYLMKLADARCYVVFMFFMFTPLSKVAESFFGEKKIAQCSKTNEKSIFVLEHCVTFWTKNSIWSLFRGGGLVNIITINQWYIL